MTDPAAPFKQLAGTHAAAMVESGMVVGLGTGSTAIFAIRAIAARLQSGALRDITAIATSRASAAALSGRAGVVEHGLFLDVATDVIVAGEEGVKRFFFEKKNQKTSIHQTYLSGRAGLQE